MSSLEVLLGDIVVGVLTRYDDTYGRHDFTFDPAYVTHPARPVLGQIFEDWLPDGIEKDDGIFPRFHHLLPLAHLPQRKAMARDAGADPDDDMALLAWLGDDLLGAIRLRVLEPIGPWRRRADRPLVVAPDDAIYRASLPGAQWKLSLTEEFKGIALPINGQAGEWIGKFHSHAFDRAVRREEATMAWARAIGIDVPEVRVVRAETITGLPEDIPRGDGDVYLVRRFDRGADGARIHIEDFAQILDLPQGEGQFNSDYEAIARVLSAIATLDDVRAFVRRLVFCVMVGNGDAHAKNWSVIYPDRRHARLAPAYDLLPTILADHSRHGLALRLRGNRDFTAVTPASFMPMAGLVSVADASMRAWVIEDAALVRSAWAKMETQERFLRWERTKLERHMASIMLM